ncbi:hypothetical protein B0J14DRAFT_644937 [Halenospora varia]|nr:hypothetical protein B0J14DRAFT_644937 [Halenospora varia]
MLFFQNKQPSSSALPQGHQASPKRITAKIKSFFHALRLPIAILTGSALTTGLTYLPIKHVQHLLAHASVNSSPSYWQHKARTEAYDGCYYGCLDIHCNDLDFAYNACRKTALASNIAGVDCDGRSMWNWRDRYPSICLDALGGIYRNEAVKMKKIRIRNQFVLIILTIIAGLIAGVMVWKVWGCVFGKSGHELVNDISPPHRDNSEREQQQQQKQLPTPAPSSPTPPAYEEIELQETSTFSSRSQRNTSPPNQRLRSSKLTSNSKWKYTAFLGILALGAQTAVAEHCWGYGFYTQHFTNHNQTINGTVHGWTGDCTTEYYVCGEMCSSTGCVPTFCSTAVLSTKPSEYVWKMGEKMRDCGFVLKGGVVKERKGAGTGVEELGMRVPNPGLERKGRVRVGVSGFNVTTAEETDHAVECSWDLGEPVY